MEAKTHFVVTDGERSKQEPARRMFGGGKEDKKSMENIVARVGESCPLFLLPASSSLILATGIGNRGRET